MRVAVEVEVLVGELVGVVVMVGVRVTVLVSVGVRVWVAVGVGPTAILKRLRTWRPASTT